MRHLKAGRKLGRNAPHRLALYRNLALALFRHERIITTLEKAKAVRPFIEKLITQAKKGTLHSRRLVIARLGSTSNAEVKPGDDKDADHRTIVQKLFDDIAPRFKDRPGGYTRVLKRHERRLGDAGRTAFLELLKEGETKARREAPPAPAPQVEEEETQDEEQPEEQQQEQPTQASEETPAGEQQPPQGEEQQEEPKPQG